MYPAIKADGKEIITIEGLELNGELSRVQKAFIDADSVQCGYCIPGAIMSAYALINEKLSPTEEDIEEAFSGNLCRCSAGYTWKKAVELALKSEKQREF
jgi:Aerobic-type carbon monoxide dehydrogenase, small subunit CoxS/CutS homologs